MRIIFAFFSFVFLPSLAAAAPCYPSDPLGTNPTNLCPVFPPPGVNANSFTVGTPKPIRQLPTAGNPVGKVIFSPTGYYTGIITVPGFRSVTTNSGQTFTYQK